MPTLFERIRLFFQEDEEDDDFNPWVFLPALVVHKRAGKTVAQASIREVMDAFRTEAFVPQVERVTQAMINKTITLEQWQNQMAGLIKEQHIASAVAGRGSRELMTFRDWGQTGGRLSFQYNRLDNFARDIATGEYSPAYIQARAKMYANATRTGYWDHYTQAHKEAGFTEERRVLNPAEHCEDCTYYSELNWMPLGSLPEPGDGSRCMVNCKCNKEYR